MSLFDRVVVRVVVLEAEAKPKHGSVQLYRFDAVKKAVAFDVPLRSVAFKPGDASRDDAKTRARSMRDTLSKGGKLPPVWLTLLPRGRFQVHDGNARVTAYRAEKIKKIPAAVIVGHPDLSSLPSVERSAWFKAVKAS